MSEPEIKSERWVQAIDDFSANCGRFEGFRKLPIRTYLAAIVIFVNEVKGKSALALSRDLDVQYKTAFVLAHKIREAMGSEMKGATIGGAGRVVEIDGCHVGGHVRPENEKRDRQDRRLAENQTGTRRVVVALRERGGRTLTMVFKTEAASIDFIRSRVDRATTIHADEAADWNALHGRFDTKRINHQNAFSLDGACTNAAESLLQSPAPCRDRPLSSSVGAYLDRYARETAFREDHRRAANGEQFTVVGRQEPPSVDFCGYWQRARAA